MLLDDYITHWDNALKGELYPKNYAQYLALNRSRFNRIYKRFIASEDFKNSVKDIRIPAHWIIISEPWCGDAAQSLPVILKLIEHVPNASYTLELRDQGNLIDHYLTNGGKGIPKVIVRDEHGSDLFVWGPRPEGATKFFTQEKTQGRTKEEISESLQRWYLQDQGASIEIEFTQLLKRLIFQF